MLGIENELSSEIEWLLLNGHPNPVRLVEVLVDQYLSQIYRLVFAILDDQESAKQATKAIFEQAPKYANRYNPEQGVDYWIYSLAYKICKSFERSLNFKRNLLVTFHLIRKPEILGVSFPLQECDLEFWFAFDKLPFQLRWVASMFYVVQISKRQIAQILDVDEEEIKNRLNTIRIQLENAVDSEYFGSEYLSTMKPGPDNLRIEKDPEQAKNRQIDKTVAASLKRRWADLGPDSARLTEVANIILKRTDTYSRTITKSFALKEYVIIGAIILVIGGLVWGVNRLFTQATLDQAIESMLGKTNPLSAATSTAQAALWTSTPTRASYPPFPTDVFYTVQEGDTLPKIARKLHTRIDTLASLNRLDIHSPLSTGQNLLIPGKINPDPTEAVTPVPTVVLNSPLTRDMEADKILSKVGTVPTNFNTVWFDLVYTYHGPSSYVGYAQSYRLQLWLGQGEAFVLTGVNGQPPAFALLFHNNQGYYAAPGNDQPWFLNMNAIPGRFSSDASHQLAKVSDIMGALINVSPNADINSEIINMKVIGTDTVVGRPALIIDEENATAQTLKRVWIDSEHAFPLLVQLFNLADLVHPMYEARVQSIAYDINFPQDLFDTWLPWRGDYPADYTGKIAQFTALSPTPELNLPNASQVPPPSDLDLSRQVLRFIYPNKPNIFDTPGIESYPVSIYAGEYYLGDMNLGNPMNLSCSRSKDSDMIAIGRISQGVDFGVYSYVDWFPLSNLQENIHSEAGLQIKEFALSPDGRWLAISSQYGPKGPGIYLIDTQTGQSRLKFSIPDSRSLVWNPDGKQLAFLGTRSRTSKTELIILDVQTSHVDFQVDLDPLNKQPISRLNTPLNSWGVQFPVDQSDLGSCGQPLNP